MSEKIEQWLAAHARPPTTIQLGLSRLQKVRDRLQLTLPMPVITVGGTNGKGSVCHLLSAMLAAAGFKVGCYTSPHLLHFGERIMTNGVSAEAEEVLDALQTIAAAGGELTYFELITLAAALLFVRQSCEVVVLEVGLGGRLDAVNVFDADVAVITNIGIDHTEYLGDTREQIALEKAGICRTGKPVVIGDTAPPPTLVAALCQWQVPAYYLGRDFQLTGNRYWSYCGRRQRLANLPPPALSGAHQLHNAATALCALECLPVDYWPGAGAVRRGLHAAVLPGRGQVLAGRPTTVLDVAHNAAAAAVLERQLFDMGYYPRTAAVLGMLARKDIGAFVTALRRRIDHWYAACPADGDLGAAEIAAQVRQAGGVVDAHSSIAAAVAAARADSNDSDRIVVTGSFLTVAEYMQNTFHGKNNKIDQARKGSFGAGTAKR